MSEVKLTITGRRKQKPRPPARAAEKRFGPFTRIEDDPIFAPPPSTDVLLIARLRIVDVNFVSVDAYSLTTRSAPADPQSFAGDPVCGLGDRNSDRLVAFISTIDGQSFATISKTRPITVQDSIAIPTQGNQFAIASRAGAGWVCGAGPSNFLTAFDVSDPGDISVTAQFDTLSFSPVQETPRNFVIKNGFLYLANNIGSGASHNGSFLATYNIATPASISQVSAIQLHAPGNVQPEQVQGMNLAASDSALYFGYSKYISGSSPTDTRRTMLKAYSLATPAVPVEVFSSTLDEQSGLVRAVTAIAINKAGTRLVLIVGGLSSGTNTAFPTVAPEINPYMQLYDIGTNPLSPVLLDTRALVNPAWLDFETFPQGVASFSGTSAIYLVGNLLYAPYDTGVDQDLDLAIFDVSSTFNLVNVIDLGARADTFSADAFNGILAHSNGVPL